MDFNSKNAIFLIEDGKALTLCKQHIDEVRRVTKDVAALLEELGVERCTRDRLTGTLSGVVFEHNGRLHPDFKVPNAKGVSYPKRHSEWAKRLAAQKGYTPDSEVISKEFGVKGYLSYQCGDGGSGFRSIGNPFKPCGFLYMSEQGPYAMWVPDIVAIAADMAANGEMVKASDVPTKLEFEGCRRIEREEWEIMVLQHKLQQKQKSAQVEDIVR